LAMCNALNDLTIYTMIIIAICIPIAFTLKDKRSVQMESQHKKAE